MPRSFPCANVTCRCQAESAGAFCCDSCQVFAEVYPRVRQSLLEHDGPCVRDEQERRGIPALVHAGDEVRCQCGRWHVVIANTRPDDLPNVAAMRYIRCGTGHYYVGEQGLPYRPECVRRRIQIRPS